MSIIGITERGDAALDFAEYASGMLPSLSYDGIVLITKNPRLLYIRMKEKEEQNLLDISKIVVHCTITGWGGSVLEPNVPTVTESFSAYLDFVDWLGPNRTVLRVDPVVPTKYGFNRARTLIVASQSRVRVSFLDMYKHVKERMFVKCPNLLSEMLPNYEGLHVSLSKRKKALRTLQKACTRRIEVCGEPGLNVTGCVSNKELALFNLPKENTRANQRAACSCIGAKKEMLTNRHPCKHNCLYCYWK